MTSHEKKIREILKRISDLAGDPPPPEDGPDELIVHCWGIYEQVDLLMGFTGSIDVPGVGR